MLFEVAITLHYCYFLITKHSKVSFVAYSYEVYLGNGWYSSIVFIGGIYGLFSDN